MLHSSHYTDALAYARIPYFCFLLSHLSQHSQQTNKHLIFNTINSTSKWQTTHFAVTLLSHCCHTILSPPPLHPIEQNLLSHYYHITVTPLSPKPFLLQKSTSSSKESTHSHQNNPCFLESIPYFPEKLPHLPEKVPYFLEKVGHNWRECSPWLRNPVTDVTEKNTKLLVIRAHARERIRTPSASTASPNLLPHPSELNPQKHSSTKKHSSTMKQPTKNQQWNNQR